MPIYLSERPMRRELSAECGSHGQGQMKTLAAKPIIRQDVFVTRWLCDRPYTLHDVRYACRPENDIRGDNTTLGKVVLFIGEMK